MQVLSVVNVGDGIARWTFDTPLTAVPVSGGGILSAGNQPDSYVGFSGATADASYTTGGNPGDTWATLAPFTGLSFAGGRTLQTGLAGLIT